MRVIARPEVTSRIGGPRTTRIGAPRRSHRFIRGVLTCAISTMAAIGALAPSASAAGSYITQTANLRSCVNTGSIWCAAFGTFASGTSVRTICWIDGSTATGAYTSRRWFLVRRGDGFEAFVHSSLVGAQTTTPNCLNVTRVKAGLRAIDRLGQTYPTSADYNVYPGDWGPYKDWSGDCKKLVALAYRDAGLTLVRGNAKPTFDYYWANRSTKGTGQLMLYGALAGFDQALPYGHISIAVGGNRVATTVGSESARQRNTIKAVSSMSGYRGWVIP
jgi:hypothetical protein